MRRKKQRVARLDEVQITREGDAAVITFLDDSGPTTRLSIGPKMREMSDAEVLEEYNECVMAQEFLAASCRHVAVEIPPGQPQLEYFASGRQWAPRGDVLRCVVHDCGPDPDRQAVIEIDDQELSIEEFGRMLTAYAGWGMRICFVPDNQLEDKPEIEVREPDDEADYGWDWDE